VCSCERGIGLLNRASLVSVDSVNKTATTNRTALAHKFMCSFDMTTWTDKETLKLIEIWGEENIQEELEGCKQNHNAFDKISRKMATAGFRSSVS